MANYLSAKAYLNLLQLEKHKEALPWQLKNYREESKEELLNAFGLTEKEFLLASEAFDSPEALSDSIAKGNGELYLTLFELWRRLKPEQETLSLFCDELDHLISDFNQNPRETEKLEKQLVRLADLIETYIDKGYSPETAFNWIQAHTAFDVESFVYQYILNLIENKEISFASELLECFDTYFPSKKWFEYLKVRIALTDDPEHGFEMLDGLIEKEGTIDFLLEVLSFLAKTTHHTQFLQVANLTEKQLETEEDFLDFSTSVMTHFRTLEIEYPAQQIELLLNRRSQKKTSELFSKYDPDRLALQELLNQKVKEF